VTLSAISVQFSGVDQWTSLDLAKNFLLDFFSKNDFLCRDLIRNACIDYIADVAAEAARSTSIAWGEKVTVLKLFDDFGSTPATS
jgi:hypothetical protein